jgi:hypothetical protein
VEEFISNELKNNSNSNIDEIADDEQEYFSEKEPVLAEEKSFFQRLFSFFIKDKKEDYFNKGYKMDDLDNINIDDRTGLMPKDSEPIPFGEIPAVRKEKRVVSGNGPSQDFSSTESDNYEDNNSQELTPASNNLSTKESNYSTEK